ncbi:MAG: hypothetical protein H6873_06900 [Hyphomicrobiaceae bacterium]|nr:hypothetical protein [Hyphomicrobiaceae bacterium]
MGRASAPRLVFAALFVWLILLAMPPALAQSTGAGLPLGGPALSPALSPLEKIATICAKCAEAEAAYHAQVDVYEAARQAYEAQIAIVRQEADLFVALRETYAERRAAFQTLDHDARELLFAGKLYDYDELVPDRDKAEEDEIAAEKALATARQELDTALRELERLRLRAVAERRKALRLESLMHQCELACDVGELALDGAPAIAMPATPTVGEISRADLPEIENFIGIVAKCANCQPLAEQVNSIRSQRRSFAVDANWAFETLSANKQTFARIEHEQIALAQAERDLYQSLLVSFTPKGPGEESMRIDEAFDNADQLDAQQRLKAIADKRSENAADMAGLQKLITDQQKGPEEALSGYRAQSALLAAAEARLAQCEETCATISVAEGGSYVDPFVDPDYPQQENVDPITAACAKCQPVADDLARTLSDRRSIAGDIQSAVWLLKGRKASLEKWQAEDEALAAEERQIADLIASGITRNAKIDNLGLYLFELDEQRTELLNNILWAGDEISRLGTAVDKLMEQWRNLSERADQLRIELTECERTCEQILSPVNQLSLDYFDTAYPIPVTFAPVSAKCADCDAVAAELNDALKARYELASKIQSTQFQMRANQKRRAPLQQQLDAVLAEESALNETVLKQPGGQETGEQAKDYERIDVARNRLQDQVDAINKAVADAKRQLETLVADHAAADETVVRLTAALAECEKKCAPAGGGGVAISMPAPDPSEFVTTNCEPCQALASMVNDAVGSRYAALRELAEANERFRQDHAAAEQRRNRLEELSQQESALNEEWLGSTDEAKRTELDKALGDIDHERYALEQQAADDSGVVRSDLDAIDAAQQKVDDLEDLEAKLRVQLAECEKQCQPPDGGAIGIPGANGQPQSPFVSTDCEPCQALASMVNDAVGTQIGAERDLKAAEDKLTEFEAAATARQEALDAALARESALNEEWLTTRDDARKAEIDKELTDVDAERNSLTDAKAGEAAQKQALEAAHDAAKAKVDELTKLIADLKAQLAECEKQCQPPDGGAIGIPGANGQPQSPFVSTVCEACQALASMVNDAVGTLIGAERDLKAAEDRLTEFEAAATARQEALDAVLARESALNEEWLATRDDARKAEIDKDLTDVDAERNSLTDAKAGEAAQRQTLQSARDAAKAKVDELTKLIADLKAQLAECEKQCQPPDGGAIGIPGANGQPQSPFVSTDCEACQALASMVNDAVGTQIGAERDLKAAEDKLTEFEAAATARQEALDAVLARESALNEEWLTTRDDARKTEIDKDLTNVDAERNSLTDAKAGEAAQKQALEAARDIAKTKVGELTKLIADLKAQLAECEKRCDPGSGQSQTGLNVGNGQQTAVPQGPAFVSTDCEPCQALASELNDVIGSLPASESALADARARLAVLQTELEGRRADLKAAQDAFTAAAVEKGRLQEAGADTSAQQDLLDANLKKAADLLTNVEDMELTELNLQDKVNAAETYFKALTAREAELRAKLADCEKQCNSTEETKVGLGEGAIQPEGSDRARPAPEFAFSIAQTEQCRRGDDCDYEIGAVNGSDRAYSGSVFFAVSGRVSTSANGGAFGDAWCSPARSGQSLCVLQADALEAGGKIDLRLTIGLPNRVPRGTELCVSPFGADDARARVQMVQVALASMGYELGSADGIAGPKTNAAMADYAEQQGLALEAPDAEDLYVAFFGPMEANAVSGPSACVEIDVVRNQTGGNGNNQSQSPGVDPGPTDNGGSPGNQNPTVRLDNEVTRRVIQETMGGNGEGGGMGIRLPGTMKF